MTDLRTANEWREIANFDLLSAGIQAQFRQAVGSDKADEVAAALRRISENMLDHLGELRMSEETLLKLLRAVSAIAVDTYLPHERQRQ